MTEAEWHACTDPRKMLNFLRVKVSDRKLRLFGVACCRRMPSLPNYEQGRTAVDIAEQFADGNASDEEFAAARVNSYSYLIPHNRSEHLQTAETTSFGIATETTGIYPGLSDADMMKMPIWQTARNAEWAKQAAILRDVLGTVPFRRVTPNSAWLTPTVTALAEAIYQERAFDRLPILADALEDAGCTNADVLNHCRQPGEHVRGCWVIDLLTGRQ